MTYKTKRDHSDVFPGLPGNSRIWIYQSDRILTSSEVSFIKNQGKLFIEGWNAHGAKLTAGVDVIHDLFLVIAANEEEIMASGCSIDASVRFVRELQSILQVDFFNRLVVAVDQEDYIQLLPLNDVEENYKQGNLQDDSHIFDNTISQLSQLRENWLKQVNESWLTRFI